MTDINYLDEYTAVLTAEISTTENKFKELGEINLSATKVLDDETYISCNFDVKVDFNSSFRNIEKLNVNEIINEKIKIKFIEPFLLMAQDSQA